MHTTLIIGASQGVGLALAWFLKPRASDDRLHVSVRAPATPLAAAPLLNARCPLEVRPVAVTLLRSSGVTSSHRGAADAAPTRDPYQYALQSPTRWAETQSQWRIGARARANDRIVC